LSLSTKPAASGSSVDFKNPPANRWFPVMAAVIAYMRPVARVPYTAHSKSGCSQVLNSRADGTVAASRLIMALRAETLRD